MQEESATTSQLAAQREGWVFWSAFLGFRAYRAKGLSGLGVFGLGSRRLGLRV